jgi:hypothetical protein
LLFTVRVLNHHPAVLLKLIKQVLFFLILKRLNANGTFCVVKASIHTILQTILQESPASNIAFAFLFVNDPLSSSIIFS